MANKGKTKKHKYLQPAGVLRQNGFSALDDAIKRVTTERKRLEKGLPIVVETSTSALLPDGEIVSGPMIRVIFPEKDTPKAPSVQEVVLFNAADAQKEGEEGAVSETQETGLKLMEDFFEDVSRSVPTSLEARDRIAHNDSISYKDVVDAYWRGDKVWKEQNPISPVHRERE